jgi:N-acetylglucosamine-6-phosphate deacetylase
MKEGILPSGEKGLVKTLAGSAAPLSFCAQKYFASMPHESIESRMDSMYRALITNPRMTTLSPQAINNLPDEKNFTIFNNEGLLMLSSCNGKVITHQQLQRPISSLLNHGLLGSPSRIQNNSTEANYPQYNS